MDMTAVVITVVILGIVIGAGIIFLRYKNKNMNSMFIQTYEMAKQAPKSKKNSFLLLIFSESINSAKNKKNMGSFQKKLNNPKYVNVQLVQMSKTLKNRSNVSDKTMKKALNLYDDYLKWEKRQSISATKQAV